MATLETIYLGDLRTEITHVQSGNKVVTDAPLDNYGKGEFISPTDMVAAALGSCIITIMDMVADRHEIDLTGTRFTTDKVMSSDLPRRIVEIKIDFYFPDNYDDKVKVLLQRAADTCPVANSLSPELKQTVNFHYKQ